jgi:tRNA threonylcarbamoyladenosine biosynthesis protein TsaE
MTQVETSSEAETEAVGRDLAARLRPGDVVLLDGTLGAGKTAFVRGLATGLGIAPDAVSSPTFTIVQEYAGRGVTLQHIDLYRLTPADVDDLALEDVIEDQIAAIEWPERWLRAPPESVRVTIDVLDEQRRRITITSSRP